MNKHVETLTENLNRAADCELAVKLDGLFGAIEKFAYDGIHSGKMDHVQADSVSLGGYGKFDRDVWPPQMVSTAKAILAEGMRRNYRNEFIARFVAKVESVESQLEEVRSIAESNHQ